MEKLKVIFRKDKEGNIYALFPECSANYGKIATFCYEGKGFYDMVIGGHMEIYIDYAIDCLKPIAENEYKHVLEFLKGIYDDVQLVTRKRIFYDDLRYKAWKNRQEGTLCIALSMEKYV